VCIYADLITGTPRPAVSDLNDMACTKSSTCGVEWFLFNWVVYSNRKQFVLTSIKIRIYKTILSQVEPSPDGVRVNISAFVGFQTALKVNASNGMVQHHNETFSCLDKEWTPIGSLDVRSGVKSEWLELDLTPAVGNKWKLNMTSSLFKVAIKVESKEKLPIKFENPAMKISKNRAHNTRPYLLLYMNDSNTKLHFDETVTLDQNAFIGAINRRHHPKRSMNGARHRLGKRSTDGGCYRHNITIDFKTIGLSYILSPISFNTKICLGLCSFDYLQLNPSKGNNHAQIMAALATYPELVPSNSTTPENPCCVPTKFTGIYLMELEIDDTIDIKFYDDLVVTDCGCR